MVPGQPWRLDATARNVTELHARAYRISLKEWSELQRLPAPGANPCLSGLPGH
ncbi:MAG: hypothetical protein WKG07_20355 [Hymenobacter sp.]